MCVSYSIPACPPVCVRGVTFLGHVSASKEIRDACTKADEQIENFLVKRGMRADVYKVLKKLSSSKSAQVWKMRIVLTITS